MPPKAVQPMNIYIGQKDIEKKFPNNDSNDYTSYIIYQNNHLLNQITDLIKENNEIQVKHDEIEEYSGKLERGRTCLQGYVRNENYIGGKYKELSVIYGNKITHLKILNTVGILFNLLFFIFYFINIPAKTSKYFITSLALLVPFLIKKNINQLSKCQELVIIDEINKYKKANNYIDDLIDNI